MNKVQFLGGLVVGCASTVGVTSWLQSYRHPQLDTTSNSSLNDIDLYNHSKTSTTGLNPRWGKIFSYGHPMGGHKIRALGNHILEYDYERRIPVWVAEHLNAKSLKGDANRSDAHFKSDPSIPEVYSAKNSDYRNSGWSRGHMAPAGDNKSSLESMKETFYLSNIVPQDVNNNGNFWNRLEIYCRELVNRYEDVWVTSGPLFISELSDDGKQFIKYQVIGESEVAVPTHLFKVIVAKKEDKIDRAAFIVPNKPIDYSQDLKQFQVSIEQLEKKAAYKFYPHIENPENIGDLCKVDGCNLMSKLKMDQYIYIKRLKGAKHLHKLNNVWKEIEEKNVPVSEKMQKLFNKQLQILPERETTNNYGHMKTSSDIVTKPERPMSATG